LTIDNAIGLLVLAPMELLTSPAYSEAGASWFVLAARFLQDLGTEARASIAARAFRGRMRQDLRRNGG